MQVSRSRERTPMTWSVSSQGWRATLAVAVMTALLGTGSVAAVADEAPDAPVAVSPASTTATGAISGRVTKTDITLAWAKPLAGADVFAVRTGPERETYRASSPTSATGGYSITGLPAGDYRVVFSDYKGSPLRDEFWKDAPREDGATIVRVGAGQTVTGIDERLEPLLTSYLAGSDRYATSVAISKRGFQPGVPCVYIASGANFPDALSAGPAAAHCGGPLLLVPPTTLPSNVAAELQRLSPKRIVIAGGTGAVSGAVGAKLDAFAPTVDRVAGKDRYETSRRIIADEFDSAWQVWVATGRNFPDALAASGAASADGIPVLIVDGVADRFDPAIAAAIIRLNTGRVLIAGDGSVVTDQLGRDLDSVAGVDEVLRFGGIDRYATAMSINRAFFTLEGTRPADALIADGTKFPDALSGAALAGALGAPLHIVPPTCTPAAVAEHLEELAVSEAHLLGYFSKLRFGTKPFDLC